jgi:hypothetical protein
MQLGVVNERITSSLSWKVDVSRGAAEEEGVRCKQTCGRQEADAMLRASSRIGEEGRAAFLKKMSDAA